MDQNSNSSRRRGRPDLPLQALFAVLSVSLFTPACAIRANQDGTGYATSIPRYYSPAPVLPPESLPSSAVAPRPPAFAAPPTDTQSYTGVQPPPPPGESPQLPAANSVMKSCPGGFVHGGTRMGYIQMYVPRGSACMHGTQTCVNGQWVGPQLFDTCAEIR